MHDRDILPSLQLGPSHRETNTDRPSLYIRSIGPSINVDITNHPIRESLLTTVGSGREESPRGRDKGRHSFGTIEEVTSTLGPFGCLQTQPYRFDQFAGQISRLTRLHP